MELDWFYCIDNKQFCQVINTETLWGKTYCKVWLPAKDTIARVQKNKLISINSKHAIGKEYIKYITAAARIANEINEKILLAPIESSVIPLPHQINALKRAVSEEKVRYLLADEVGLGKTVEAGLIMRELKIRGMVNRTLVVVPKGLVNQWVAELYNHFNEHFKPVITEDIKAFSRIVNEPITDDLHESELDDNKTQNPWLKYNQVVVSMDSFKPLEKRMGWTTKQIADYNRDRFESLISANWDMVIVDEAHRLGGSTDQVARFKLGRGLSSSAPYFLMLSATPHQGKSDAFHRLFSLIEPKEFPVIESVTRERVQPYIIRTEKRSAIDAEGEPLFKPRVTQLISVAWDAKHSYQQQLYNSVTDYVREGYNQAIKEKRNYIGFLMVLMQRMVVSSTSAIKSTLEKRQAALSLPEEQLSIPTAIMDSWHDLDAQEQADYLLDSKKRAYSNEVQEIKSLLELASLCEQTSPDAKAETLLEWIYRLQSEESDPELKVLVFTEFVSTQAMLEKFLNERGFKVVCLNGSKSMAERKKAQDAFAVDARILISTDAGGEGINLQFCNVVINYDMPWNPMRLEQRIGRVDRIGQAKDVRAINFIFEDSIENRVREVLEEKLNLIYKEFGIDKASDVLDSADSGQIFDKAFIKAILDPDHVNETASDIANELRMKIEESRSAAEVFEKTFNVQTDEAKKLTRHPLSQWLERMTINYLISHGGVAEKNKSVWRLMWPNGKAINNATFTKTEAEHNPQARHVTLENNSIRKLVTKIPWFIPAQSVPTISIPGLSKEINGLWSIWQISINSKNRNAKKIFPLFITDCEKTLLPTAKHIWEQLLTKDFEVISSLENNNSKVSFALLRKYAEEHGEPLYNELLREHQLHVRRLKDKNAYAFAMRRCNIERVGLTQVRNHRMKLLENEEDKSQLQLAKERDTTPEMLPLLIVRVEGG